MRARLTLLIGIMAALMTLVASGMAANGLYELFFKLWPVWANNRGWVALGLFFFLAFSFLLLFRNRQVFQAARGLKYEVCEKPLPCVVMLLSPPDRKDVIFSDDPFSITVSGKQLPTTIEQDIVLLEETRWPWQQMLRGLLPHMKDGTLEHVYLIGSSDTKTRSGSFKSLHIAKKLIKHYLPDTDVKVELHPSQVHFEDFDALTNSLYFALRKLKKHYPERKIIVDVTGGQKTTSIAGAVVTFNSGVTFQYVQTDDPYDVLKYDVVIASAPSL